jgi:hypothetical protein
MNVNRRFVFMERTEVGVSEGEGEGEDVGKIAGAELCTYTCT